MRIARFPFVVLSSRNDPRCPATGARSLAPEKEFLASLKNTTSKNTGIRLEYTVAVNVGQLPEENRNWQCVRAVSVPLLAALC